MKPVTVKKQKLGEPSDFDEEETVYEGTHILEETELLMYQKDKLIVEEIEDDPVPEEGEPHRVLQNTGIDPEEVFPEGVVPFAPKVT